MFLFAQAAYFLSTGVWPLISARTFQKVTGPKADFWLVKTIGLLIGVVGLNLLFAASSRRATVETAFAGAGTAAALAAADVVYVAKRRISPVYLLDALAELAILGGWAWIGRNVRKHS